MTFDNARHMTATVRLCLDELHQLIRHIEQRIALLEREQQQRDAK
jgi:hypothetical protein